MNTLKEKLADVANFHATLNADGTHNCLIGIRRYRSLSTAQLAAAGFVLSASIVSTVRKFGAESRKVTTEFFVRG